MPTAQGKQMRIFPGEIYFDDDLNETSVYERQNILSEMKMDNEEYSQPKSPAESTVGNKYDHSGSIRNQYMKDSMFVEVARKNIQESMHNNSKDGSKIQSIPAISKTDIHMHKMYNYSNTSNLYRETRGIDDGGDKSRNISSSIGSDKELQE